MKRTARILETLAWTPLVGSLLVIGAWALGRTLTDRVVVLEPLAWIPAVLAIPLATLLALLGGNPFRRKRAPRRRVAQRVLLLVCALAFVFVALADWRLHRLGRPAVPPESFTLAHWNMTAPSAQAWPLFLDAIPDPPPDVLCLSNSLPGKRITELLERLGPEYQGAFSYRFAVVSRFPVVESRGFSLRIPHPSRGGTPPDASTAARNAITGARDVDEERFHDPGWLLCATLDTTGVIGRETVVWLIDLPSDLRWPRSRLSELVRSRLDEILNADDPARRVPLPDIIVGDFNIPRASASLARITSVGGRDFRHAHDDAGRGPDATWPRAFPLYHIDHVYVGPSLRAVRYHVTDPGRSMHAMQHATVAPNER